MRLGGARGLDRIDQRNPRLGLHRAQLDWGMTVSDPAIADALRARFQQTWETSLPYRAVTEPELARRG